ncbi:hypothetical protein HMN09_00326100 [Mycena chlorophos]|uniref:Uncharacterized protein n=1 Tax=Mycena chlorophos TaxID=658473 RepID=A0A8H6WGU7_MYCCL|nr:hypothetical protein HMN09_00326100 [Mycena chlorophos]
MDSSSIPLGATSLPTGSLPIATPSPAPGSIYYPVIPVTTPVGPLQQAGLVNHPLPPGAQWLEDLAASTRPKRQAALHNPALRQVIHPPFSQLPEDVSLPPGASVTYSLLHEHPNWFLDTTDYISTDSSSAIPGTLVTYYPRELVPPAPKLQAQDSSMTSLRCVFCPRTYSGAHAKSVWMRHVKDKHCVVLPSERLSRKAREAAAISSIHQRGKPGPKPKSHDIPAAIQKPKPTPLPLPALSASHFNTAPPTPPVELPPSSPWTRSPSPPPPEGICPPRMRGKEMRSTLRAKMSLSRLGSESRTPTPEVHDTSKDSDEYSMRGIEATTPGPPLSASATPSPVPSSRTSSPTPTDCDLEEEETEPLEFRAQFGFGNGNASLAHLVDRELSASPPPPTVVQALPPPSDTSSPQNHSDGPGEQSEPEPESDSIMMDTTEDSDPEPCPCAGPGNARRRLMGYLEEQFGIEMGEAPPEAVCASYLPTASVDAGVERSGPGTPNSADVDRVGPAVGSELGPSKDSDSDSGPNSDAQMHITHWQSFFDDASRAQLQSDLDAQLELVAGQVSDEVVHSLRDVLRNAGDEFVDEVMGALDSQLQAMGMAHPLGHLFGPASSAAPLLC